MNARNFSPRTWLISSLPSVSRLSRQCGILNISQPYRPARPVTGIAFLYTQISPFSHEGDKLLDSTRNVFLGYKINTCGGCRESATCWHVTLQPSFTLEAHKYWRKQTLVPSRPTAQPNQPGYNTERHVSYNGDKTHVLRPMSNVLHCQGPSFTPIRNHRQNYSFLNTNFQVFL
jgi:hypothetical protein